MLPLKAENERVVRENNELHREIIDVKERLEASEIKWRGSLKQAQAQVDDAVFAAKQKDIRIKQLETDILELQEGKVPASNASGAMEITSALNPNPIQPAEARPELGVDTDAKVWAEELRRADERAQEFQQQIQALELERNNLTEVQRMLEDKVKTRDNEIVRLSSLYEGGQNLSALNAEYVNESNSTTIKKLTDQLDYVNGLNKQLEADLIARK